MNTELEYLVNENEFERAETARELRVARQHRDEITRAS